MEDLNKCSRWRRTSITLVYFVFRVSWLGFGVQGCSWLLCHVSNSRNHAGNAPRTIDFFCCRCLEIVPIGVGGARFGVELKGTGLEEGRCSRLDGLTVRFAGLASGLVYRV